MDTRIGPENENANPNNKPKNDASEVVRRHLEDKNHQITDEDIRNVRIATEDNEPVTTGAEAQERFMDKDPEDKNEENDLPDPNDKPGTPWDVVK